MHTFQPFPADMLEVNPFTKGKDKSNLVDEFQITINPAKHAGIADRVGSLEVGKDADIAIFDDNPLETFTNTLYTIIDGEIVYTNRFRAKILEKSIKIIKTLDK